MNWKYKGEEITDISQFPENTFGFVYIIRYLPTSMSYVGKKVLHHNRTLPPLKGQKRKRKIVKESDWKTYWGSSKPLLEIVKSNDSSNFEKTILQLANTKKQLTYYETKYLFQYEVLENPDKYYNFNILGKFFNKDLEV